MGNPKEFTCVEWFYGGGGNHQGLSRVIPNLRCIAICEREGYAVSNLVAAMEEGRMAPAPIWTDCRTFPVEPFLDRRLDLFIASYPCQGESTAGNQLGSEDPRFLWPYCRDFIAATRPVWCFFENVRGHVNTSMVNVLRDLAELHYAVEPGIFSAEECGGTHSRERVFILARDMAHTHSKLHDGCGEPGARGGAESANSGINLAYSDSKREQQPDGGQRESGRRAFNGVQAVADTYPSGLGTGGGPWLYSKRQEEGESFPGFKNVAHADNKRLERAGELGQPATKWTTEAYVGHDFSGCRPCFPQSPPGPSDADGWYRVLYHRPDLAPSLRRSEAERIFRRVADGVADESYLHELRGLFCENRVDRLRMLGNGVYPYTAIVAWLTLMEKFRQRDL